MRGSSGARMTAQGAAEAAVGAVGCGYDLTGDLRLARAKPAGRLVEVDAGRARELSLPGGAVVAGVPAGIVADKGERTRFRSDVLSFAQMAEQVNQSLSLAGKIPSGAFNAMFDYRGCWHRDAAATRSLCFDGRFVGLYSVEAVRAQLALQDRVKEDLPPFWDPPALAEFIDKYGTHVIVGVKMGGKDVVCVKQLKGSSLTQSDVQARLKKLADDKFSQDGAGDDRLAHGLNENFGPGSAAWQSFRSPVVSHKDDVVCIHIRRGGVDSGQGHDRWLSTITAYPDVISMSFVPITSLLTGVRGCGFLNHAVNLYLRYKPPIEELQQFLEFQVPRHWAPEFGELPLCLQRRKNSLPSLQFTLMGPKLHVNTAKVDSGNRPVTGIRLFLEGKKNDRLGVHLQHLSVTPSTITVVGEAASAEDATVNERDYIEPVRSPLLSHVCTAPVQYHGARIDDCAAIVTRAWLEVRDTCCLKKVLFLRLGFSGVAAMKIRRSEWDGPASVVPRKSGSLSARLSAALSGGLAQVPPPPAEEEKVEVNSAIFPKGPPVPLPVQRMARHVDTTEVMRGPDDQPGYWVVTGAKLCVEGGKVALKVKYSLLIAVQEDTDV
ncbi:MACPF domain-containing protein NSL1-like [Panicum miliaceum]|uniref:MACPF domain-containing protein NSL1-like n=1 Tax=Panicum miliaceum TaxID=4540 RepID=A0A3L6T2C5_PANMI|nr:MACPF domain-containing protein NSL1-like [Panicum miliaceum]